MREELEISLIDKYPQVLSLCSAGSFSVGDGWFWVLDALFGSLSKLSEDDHESEFLVEGAETRFGRLKVKVRKCGEIERRLIEHAERMAWSTCEQCGKPGEWCATDGYFRTACADHARDPHSRKDMDEVLRVFVDMDDVITNFKGAFARDFKNNPACKWPQSRRGFFTELEPVENAIEAVKALAEISSMDIHILTAPSPRNPLSYTEKRVWVAEHLGYEFVKRLHISPRKDFFDGDILIDDNNRGKGQDLFRGRLIHFGSDDYPDWPNVLAEVICHPGRHGVPVPLRSRLTGLGVDNRQATERALRKGLLYYRFVLMDLLLSRTEPELKTLIGASEKDIVEWREANTLPFRFGRALYDIGTIMDWAFGLYRGEPRKAVNWISRSLPALSGASPLQYYSKTGDIKVIRGVIERIKSG